MLQFSFVSPLSTQLVSSLYGSRVLVLVKECFGLYSVDFTTKIAGATDFQYGSYSIHNVQIWSIFLFLWLIFYRRTQTLSSW